MSKLEKTREKLNRFIQENPEEFHLQKMVQIFNVEGGDEMTKVYQDSEITILYCFPYQYFEIFGLTKTEWEQLRTIVPLSAFGRQNQVYLIEREKKGMHNV